MPVSQIMVEWQKRLQDEAASEGLPDPLPRWGADGLGGKETQAAIVAFQTRRGIRPITGQFDDATRKALAPHAAAHMSSTEVALLLAALAHLPFVPEPVKDFLMFPNIVKFVVGLLPGLPDDVNKIRAALGELVTDAADRNGIEGLRDSARFARIVADELDKIANTLDPSGTVQPANPIINK